MKSNDITAIASTLIAAAALSVSVWTVLESRLHNSLLVAPSLQILIHVDQESPYSGIIARNLGLGPAIIEASEIQIENKKMLDLGYGGLKTALAYIKLDEEWVTFSSIAKNRIIPAGESIPIVTVSNQNFQKHIGDILSAREKIRIKLTYRSLYQNEKVAVFPQY